MLVIARVLVRITIRSTSLPVAIASNSKTFSSSSGPSRGTSRGQPPVTSFNSWAISANHQCLSSPTTSEMAHVNSKRSTNTTRTATKWCSLLKALVRNTSVADKTTWWTLLAWFRFLRWHKVAMGFTQDRTMQAHPLSLMRQTRSLQTIPCSKFWIRASLLAVVRTEPLSAWSCSIIQTTQQGLRLMGVTSRPSQPALVSFLTITARAASRWWPRWLADQDTALITSEITTMARVAKDSTPHRPQWYIRAQPWMEVLSVRSPQPIISITSSAWLIHLYTCSHRRIKC